MPKVHFIREEKVIEVPAGANLRKESIKAGINLYPGPFRIFNCRGFAICGSCRVLLKDGTIRNSGPKSLAERMTPWHNPLYGFAEIGHEDEMRLACQTTVMGDIEVLTMPDFNWHGEESRDPKLSKSLETYPKKA